MAGDYLSFIQQGWQCPCCKTVYNPTVMACNCRSGIGFTAQPVWAPLEPTTSVKPMMSVREIGV